MPTVPIDRPEMSTDEQTEKWVAGNPVHNHRVLIGTKLMRGGECCPDFSCCHPNLLAPEEERKRFRDNPKDRPKMLGEFLARMLESKGFTVKGVGGASERVPDWFDHNRDHRNQ